MFNKFSFLLIGSAVLASCATQPSGPDPLSLCQADQASCNTERQQCLDSLDRVSKSLENSNSTQTALSRKLASCESETQEFSGQAQSLVDAKADLEKRLQESIRQKDVQIKLLNDKLSVSVLDRILFDSGSANIRAEGLDVLGEVAEVLVTGTELIRVEGHTDDVPISALLKSRYPTNWELSGARAISVVRLFQETHEIEPQRLEAVGHSFYQPIALNDTPENRQRNRRVEVVLTSVK